MNALARNVGAIIQSLLAVIPVATVAAVINGPSIDRQGFLSAVLSGLAGAVTGAPTTQSVIYKLQESVDGSTGWTDVTGEVMDAITAVNTGDELDINLSSLERYVRVVATVSFTGGTTPTFAIAGTLTLGGANSAPV